MKVTWIRLCAIQLTSVQCYDCLSIQLFMFNALGMAFLLKSISSHEANTNFSPERRIIV
jgi:hypothetical protein